MSTPARPANCWPVDETACPDFATFDVAVQDMAKDLAGMTLRMLTAGVVGGCPITIRPCSVPCISRSKAWRWEGGTFVPTVTRLGTWVNIGCGCGWACGHDSAASVVLPSAWVGEVVSVRVDGVVVDPSKYRVDDGNVLVRTDGQAWPTTQDIAAEDTQAGTFSITYAPGRPVDTLGAYAAGLLACEFAKALTSKPCALPKSATAITRQGVSMTLTPGAFPKGLTGLHVVDAYILSVNPHALKTPPAVISPDLLAPTTTTWRAP